VEFDVRFPDRLDLAASFEVFRRWGDDGIDRWDGRTLVRTCRVGGEAVAYAASIVDSVGGSALRVQVSDETARPLMEQHLITMFVTAPEALASLVAADPMIAALDQRYPGVRPVLQSDPLTALVRSISAQQVNLRWAVTTRRRLGEAFGRRHRIAGHTVYSLEAPPLAHAPVSDLRALQFTTRKAGYLVAVASAAAQGRLKLEELRALSDDQVRARLTALPGVGRWTADWFLARTLGRPIVAAGDLGVRKAIGAAYFGGALASEIEVRQATAHWGAAAGVAQQLLLHAYAHAGQATLAKPLARE